MFSSMKNIDSATTEIGARSMRNRPVTSATAITMANTPSGGAGSTATTPSSSSPSATAAS